MYLIINVIIVCEYHRHLLKRNSIRTENEIIEEICFLLKKEKCSDRDKTKSQVHGADSPMQVEVR